MAKKAESKKKSKKATKAQDDVKSVFLVGVGGQGIILASEVLSHALLLQGYDVKKSEIHGMSQRGGSVTSHVRFGKRVFSPVIPEGKVDVLLAFEKLEALRVLHMLAPKGTVIVNDEEILPTTVEFGNATYPTDIDKTLAEATKHVTMLKATEVAKEIGKAQVFNTILLGVLSRHLDVPEEHWYNAIKEYVKSEFYDLNVEAFKKGRTL